MSEPLKLICRTCGESSYTENGMRDKQLQEWYEIRHELDVVRAGWPDWSADAPRMSRDDDSECTRFLCAHKDHDLCIGEPYSKETREFDKSKDKPDAPEIRRFFRELVGPGKASDVMEIDKAPRLHYSIVKPKKMRGMYDQSEILGVTAPDSSIRYVWKRDEMVLLRVYVEEGK